MAQRGSVSGAGGDAGTGLSTASTRRAEAATQKRERACSSASAHLQKALKRFKTDEAMVALAIRHLDVLFHGQSPEEDELPNLSGYVLQQVRSKFAMTCLLHRVSNLPGQSENWYSQALVSAQSFIDEQRATTAKPAPVSHSPANMPRKRNGLRLVAAAAS